MSEEKRMNEEEYESKKEELYQIQSEIKTEEHYRSKEKYKRDSEDKHERSMTHEIKTPINDRDNDGNLLTNFYKVSFYMWEDNAELAEEWTASIVEAGTFATSGRQDMGKPTVVSEKVHRNSPCTRCGVWHDEQGEESVHWWDMNPHDWDKRCKDKHYILCYRCRRLYQTYGPRALKKDFDTTKHEQYLVDRFLFLGGKE